MWTGSTSARMTPRSTGRRARLSRGRQPNYHRGGPFDLDREPLTGKDDRVVGVSPVHRPGFVHDSVSGGGCRRRRPQGRDARLTQERDTAELGVKLIVPCRRSGRR